MQRGKTGKGYVYYRDRSNGSDTTVYEHQVMALEFFAAEDVFHPDTDVHHKAPGTDVNIPWLLEVVDGENHRQNDRTDPDLQKIPPLYQRGDTGAMGASTSGP